MRDRLVRGGVDVQLGNVTPRELSDGSYMMQADPNGLCRHTAEVVFREMMLQICADYPGLPDVRTLSIDEIAFFYNGIREKLAKHTK